MKTIILTGGGTAGHVTPNLALVPALQEAGFEIKYIGTHNGLERELVCDAGLDYASISSGKLRRYFSFKNFTDPFRVTKGFFDAKRIMKQYKPDIVFSKGGFVTVPVVYAAHSYHIPIIIHESDITPGLANKLAMKKATRICYNFPETAPFFGQNAIQTGAPIRKELFLGNRLKALNLCGFTANKPVLMVTGGSLGAENLNLLIRAALPELLKNFQIAHLCGKGKINDSLIGTEGYIQFEYVREEMKDFFAMADLIVSRSGANSICEIAALSKPNLLIPLSSKVSRGDQILNAQSFCKRGFSEMLDEDIATPKDLVNMVTKIYANRNRYVTAMQNANLSDGVNKIIKLIQELSQ